MKKNNKKSALPDNKKSYLEEIEELIYKRHEYYDKQDKKYRKLVRDMKILIAFLSMLSTIILGVRVGLSLDYQVNIGLILSSVTTFVSGFLAYYNYEKYWIRNVIKHINMNILRDQFLCDKSSNKLDEERLEYYEKRLRAIEEDNIQYWTDLYNEK